jgi:ABC-2 type transport system ATP-binding protein
MGESMTIFSTSPRPHTSSALPEAIHAERLTKRYAYVEQGPTLKAAMKGLFATRKRERTAVDALSLRVPTGQIIGLLGPNGAGKTTTIKMMCGLIRPSSGELRVLGHVPARRSFDFLRHISVVFGQKAMLWWDVSTYESLLIHKRMYGLSHRKFESSVRELSDRLSADGFLHVPVRKLSLGQRMRCELMLALLHRPRLLFADEPTVGLDVVAKLQVREFLAEVNRDFGTTIVLTSHDMNDVAALAQRVAVIDRGVVSFDGDLGLLRARARPAKQVTLAYRDPVTATGLGGLGVTALPSADPRVLRLDVARDDLPALLAAASGWGRLADVEVLDTDLDHLLMDLFTTAGGAE